MVYVLAFASTNDEFLEIQSYMHEWKEREYMRSNLYVRYFLAMAPAGDRDSSSATEPSGASMRHILLFLEQWISDFATGKDIVIVLNGLAAVKSFRAPRPGRRGTCIIPFLQDGKDAQEVKLFAPIVFSRLALDAPVPDPTEAIEGPSVRCGSGGSCKGEFDVMDVRAFAGMMLVNIYLF